MNRINMSSESVTARLRRMAQLRRLCLSLGRSKGVKQGGPEGKGRAETVQEAEQHE